LADDLIAAEHAHQFIHNLNLQNVVVAVAKQLHVFKERIVALENWQAAIRIAAMSHHFNPFLHLHLRLPCVVCVRDVDLEVRI